MTDLEKLLAEATPGPWVYDSEDQGSAWGVNFSIQQAENRLVDVAEMVSDEADARLIALAPQLASALIEARRAMVSLIAVADSNPHCPIGHVVEHGASDARTALARIDAIMGERDD